MKRTASRTDIRKEIVNAFLTLPLKQRRVLLPTLKKATKIPREVKGLPEESVLVAFGEWLEGDFPIPLNTQIITEAMRLFEFLYQRAFAGIEERSLYADIYPGVWLTDLVIVCEDSMLAEKNHFSTFTAPGDAAVKPLTRYDFF